MKTFTSFTFSICSIHQGHNHMDLNTSQTEYSLKRLSDFFKSSTPTNTNVITRIKIFISHMKNFKGIVTSEEK